MPSFLVTSDQAEVCPLSRGVMLHPVTLTSQPEGSTPILPITERLSLSPPSPTRRPIGSPCGSLSLLRQAQDARGRSTGLPRSMQVPAWVRFRLSAGGAPSAIDELGAPIPDPLPFGPSLFALAGRVSTFGLFSVTTFISGSHLLTIPRNPSPRPLWCWQSPCPLTVSLPSTAFSPPVLNYWDEGYTCPQGFTPHRYQ